MGGETPRSAFSNFRARVLSGGAAFEVEVGASGGGARCGGDEFPALGAEHGEGGIYGFMVFEGFFNVFVVAGKVGVGVAKGANGNDLDD